MPLQLRHLSRDQHLKLAKLLNEAQDNLIEAARIVSRAPYTDETLRACRQVQERLIDRLREAWNETQPYQDNPYQSVGYGRR